MKDSIYSSADALHGALATRVFAFYASVFVQLYYEGYPIRRNRGRASVYRLSSMQIDTIKDHRSNNFDTLRILAAFSVMISHSFTLEGNAAEPLFIATDGQSSIGDLAVLIFFAISGF